MESQKTTIRVSTLIRLMLVFILAFSVFSLVACKDDESQNEEPNGNVETPDDPTEHEHVFGAWVTTQDPTCTTAGTKERTCTVEGCDKKETADVAPLGHTMTLHAAVAATCNASGNTAYYVCSVCNKLFTDENGKHETTLSDVTIAALNHDLERHDAQAPTCTAIGWDAYDTCSRCDYTTYQEKAALGHNPVHHDAKEPTCTAVGWDEYDTCSRCDYTTYQEKAALGHDTVHHDAQAATCTEIGWNAYDTCSRCDYTTYQEKAALGHDTVHHNAQAPTCTEIGWDAYDTCSRCNYTTYQEKAALGHAYENGVCSRCGQRDPIYYTDGLNFALSEDDTYSVTGYGGSATDVIIPVIYQNKAVTKIAVRAFYQSGLTSVIIPDGVTTIESDAFSYSRNLTSINVPKSVTVIGGGILQSCSGLTSISVAEGNPKYHSDNNCLIETASKTLIVGCKNSVIPTDGSVTAIGDHAFYGCRGLTSISIPDGVTSIGMLAFYYCTGLTTLAIPDGVTSIEYEAFRSSGLVSISIPEGVTKLRCGLFYLCSDLASIVLPKSMATIEDRVFGSDPLSAIYYAGSASDWKEIKDEGDNPCLSGATVYCFCEAQPTEGGNWWHYVEGVPTAWPHIHGWGDWTITAQPTCTEPGEKTRTCSFCNETETEEVPALGHNYENGVCTRCGNEKAYLRVDADGKADETGDYLYFGYYPQTIKADGVTITDTVDQRGYYLGSDNEYYVKVTANPNYNNQYTFSNGELVTRDAEYYFKVVPIKWRILEETDEKLFILCDSIIANQRFYDGDGKNTLKYRTAVVNYNDDYYAGNGSTVSENVYDNNYQYSDVRKWLNETFYAIAFTELQQAVINTTIVDNSASGIDDTEDKIFLLSEGEASNVEYFENNDERCLQSSDYSKATGTFVSTDTDTYGNGNWLVRSRGTTTTTSGARRVYKNGTFWNAAVNWGDQGVVPAMWIDL